MNWHLETIEQTQKLLCTGAVSGLTDSQVLLARNQHGANILPEVPGKKITSMIFEQLANFMIIVLIAAAIVSALMGEIHDSLVILFIVVLNAVIGVVQEYRAEKTLQALKEIITPTAIVIRNGEKEKIPTEELVPGDLVMLEAGDSVPADLRLSEIHSLKIDEATLTGESVPVEKNTTLLISRDLPTADKTNMAFSGTSVTYGRGRGYVTSTGSDTEFGKIAHLLLSEQRVKTPLQQRLDKFGKKLTIFLILLCICVFILGILRGGDPLLMFLTAVSLAVAAIPEALPSVVTVCLAIGAKVLAKKKALIKNLPAVEALGSVSFICSDKTGTITKNVMHAEDFFIGEDSLSNEFWHAICLNNDTQFKAGEFFGDPTEVALIRGAISHDHNPQDVQHKFPRFLEIPFDSKRKLMSTLHKFRDGPGVGFLITKGAPEVLLPLCGAHSLLKTADKMAAKGLRVLAFARKDLNCDDISCGELKEGEVHQLETSLGFLGLVGLIDPPREEIKQAVTHAKSAGITPVMITGDHPLTAKTIAQRVGIIDCDDQLVLTGAELDKISDEDLKGEITNIRVFSRCSPEQKIRIVKTLQSLGEHVAMTGDGVNDAPSLKRADVGIAMGITGTHVAKEAAAITLLDDNFASIVNAVREGRRILANIKKFIQFALTGNTGEIITILMAPAFGLPIPLLPIHILWVNLVTDGLPGLALAGEIEEEGIMSTPPRSSSEGLLTKRSLIHVVFYGSVVGACTLWAASIGYKQDALTMQTMAFSVLNFSQLLLVMELRFERWSVFNFAKMRSNISIHLAFYISFAIVLFGLYVPMGQKLFKLRALSPRELCICIAISTIVIWVFELEKFLQKRVFLVKS
ncbi:MAG: cation-translocating P-type ATPase [Bacteriovoracaceae bacterium]|jgi:P-type Ca2+ transporter type 2C|nr:cation-translocating P-type ATPase [Bacteriovoracaceae bacterium]